MIRALICKLPRWMGGGHREKRFTGIIWHVGGPKEFNRKCNRCGATRLAKPRKRNGT